MLTSMRGWLAGSIAALIPLCAALGCAAKQRPKELVTLEEIRADPTLSGLDRRAFDLLTAAEDLSGRANAAWLRGDMYLARRDATMAQIKMKTALAMLQTVAAKARIAQLDAELAATTETHQRAGEQLAILNEEIALLSQLRATKLAAAEERKRLSEQVNTVKKQAVTERQKAAEQLAAEKRRAEALDGIRRAELALRIADTVDAPRYAKAQYVAASNMLQEAHREFGAGLWAEALARTALARTEAESGIKLARPQYEKAAAAVTSRARDRSLQEDATAIPGVKTHLERDGDLQRLVLLFEGLFGENQAVVLSEGGKGLDAIKNLLATYPTYPAHITGLASGEGTPEDRSALSLARANAVFWALVTRGIDPKRVSVDSNRPGGPVAGGSGATATPKSSQIEITILYHRMP